MKLQNPKYLYLLTLLILISIKLTGQSGDTFLVNSYGINMSFVDDRSKIKSNELAANILRIVNNTNKDMHLILQLTPPAGWKLFGKQDQTIDLKAKDSIFIPVRVRPLLDIKGNTNYVVNAYLSSEQFTITNTIWYIAIDKVSQWNVFTPDTKVYFTGSSDTAQFDVTISNSGNSDEALLVNLNPDKEIEILNSGNSLTTQNTFPVFLKVGQDTTLRFSVRYVEDNFASTSIEDGMSKYKDTKQYRVKIQVRNERPNSQGSNKLWTGNIDFVELPNSTKMNDASVESVPVTVEFNTYDIMTQSTYSSLNLYGNKKYKNNSNLTYYYQADFVKNQMDIKSYLGNYLYLSYIHEKFGVELGDVGSNRPGSTLNGKGLKAYFNIANNRIGGIYIRKPRLFDTYYAQGYGGFHTYRSENLFIDNYYQHINNSWSKINSDFATSDWNYRITRKHIIRFGGGYSLENHFWNPGSEKILTGYGWKLGYSGNFNKLTVSANSYYGSKNYSPMRGIFSLTGSARYRINQSYSVSASGYRFSFQPEIYNFGQLTNDSLYNIQDNYSIKLNYQKDKNIFIFQPKFYTINSNPIASKTSGVAFEYRRLSRTAFKFYTSIFAGYSSFERNPEVGNIFISFVQASLRYNRFQFNTRYYYGPYYTIEQVDYIREQTNPQKIYTTLFYDHWFLQNKIRLNINMNYFYTTIHNRNQLITRPELFYYAPGGFQFSIYARYSFFGEGSYIRNQYNAGSTNYIEEVVPQSKTDRFEIGAGVKFNVNMPTGIKRYYKVKVIAFRDINGNGVMDPGEKGIDNMLIMLTKNDTLVNLEETETNFNKLSKIYELVTNSKGQVEYDNIPVGEYIITARPLTSMGGWFDGKTFYRTIDKNKEIYIPLSKGARISGGILTERAKYTDNKPVFLGNIRVTAVNAESGKTFSTLTDNDGQFVLFAPNGSYIIMVNDGAVGSRFEFIQNNIPLTITKDFENYNVSFYLAEKERKMRMSGNNSKPNLPVQRNVNPTPTEPLQNNNDEPSIDSIEYMQVSPLMNDSAAYVVQIYSEAKGKMAKNQFESLNGIITVKCVESKNGGFYYISETYTKEKAAEKLLKKVRKAGFDQAKVVPMIFE